MRTVKNSLERAQPNRHHCKPELVSSRDRRPSVSQLLARSLAIRPDKIKLQILNAAIRLLIQRRLSHEPRTDRHTEQPCLGALGAAETWIFAVVVQRPGWHGRSLQPSPVETLGYPSGICARVRVASHPGTMLQVYCDLVGLSWKRAMEQALSRKHDRSLMPDLLERSQVS